MEQLRTGLWTWTAPHPEWHEQPVVRSYAVERGGALVLIDPIAPPPSLLEGRELQVALTRPWHARSAPELTAAEAELESHPAFYPDERVLVLEEHGALVFGDSWPGGPIPDDWLPEGKTRATTRGSRVCCNCRPRSCCRRTATRRGSARRRFTEFNKPV